MDRKARYFLCPCHKCRGGLYRPYSTYRRHVIESRQWLEDSRKKLGKEQRGDHNEYWRSLQELEDGITAAEKTEVRNSISVEEFQRLAGGEQTAGEEHTTTAFAAGDTDDGPGYITCGNSDEEPAEAGADDGDDDTGDDDTGGDDTDGEERPQLTLHDDTPRTAPLAS